MSPVLSIAMPYGETNPVAYAVETGNASEGATPATTDPITAPDTASTTTALGMARRLRNRMQGPP